jgi:type IV pilus assembly protein PilM
MHILSLYLDGRHLQAALIHRNKKNTTTKFLRSFLLDHTNVKQLDILQTALADVSAEIISGLDASQLFIRDIHLKLSSERAILSALPFQIESLLPFAPDQVVLVPIIKKKKTETEISLYATQNTAMMEHLEQMAALGIEPDQVSCAPKAVLRLAEHSVSDCASLFFFHLGLDKSFYAVSIDGQMKISQPFKWGLAHFLEALKRDAPDQDASTVDLQNLDRELYPELFSVALQFQRDIDRAFIFLQKKYSCSSVFLTGELSKYFNSKAFLKQCLGSSFTYVEPRWEGHTTAEAETYAVALGLTLDHSARDDTSIQFRQGSFTHSQAFKKKFKQLGVTLLCSLSLAGLLWGYQTLYQSKKKTALMQRFKQESGLDREENLAAGLDKWEKMLSEKKQVFAYKPTAPKASDVLQWLSTHPKLSSKNPKEKIEIKSFDYALTKYPKLPATQEAYQAKVDLEFTSSSPRFARDFHEALMKDASMVNTKLEISWNVNHNLYRTSFFLKNRVEE